MNHSFFKMNCRLLLFCIAFCSLLGASWSMLTLAPAMQEVVRYVNESYIVTCTNEGVGEGINPAVTWSKGKSATFNEKGHPHVTSMNNGTALVFERINTADRGKYTCRTNEQQISFELIVILPISFMDTASVQTVQEYRSGVIKCKVKGDPLPKIVWKFQGKDLNSTKYKYLPDGLKILNVSLADRGIYTCRAYQVSHLTSMFEEKGIHLNVQHKPVHKPVHAKVDQAYGYIGGEVNLTCEAIAEPAAKFTWYRQHKRTIPGRILQEDHWSILQLFIHNDSVFGDYLCKATNELGTLDQIISLQEGVKPPSPQKLKLRAASSDSLDVEVGGPDLNATKLPQNMMPYGIRIQYRIKAAGGKWSEVDLYKLDEDGGGSYVLAGLVHNRRYEIRAATRNVAGLSDYTPSVSYETLRLHADQVTSGTPSYTVVHLLHVSVASLLSFLATLL